MVKRLGWYQFAAVAGLGSREERALTPGEAVAWNARAGTSAAEENNRTSQSSQVESVIRTV